MKVSRTGIVAALVWLLVVAGGSAMVWAVISRAGDQLVSGAGSTLPAATTTPTTSSAPATATPSPHASPSGRAHHTPTSAHTTPSVPAPPPSSQPGPPSSSATHAKPPPAAVRRTWQGNGGLVLAECRGATVSLQSASPNAGFSVEVGARGPARVEVEFTGHGDQAGVKVEVTSHCSGGTPTFSAETSGHGGGGDDGGGDGPGD